MQNIKCFSIITVALLCNTIDMICAEPPCPEPIRILSPGAVKAKAELERKKLLEGTPGYDQIYPLGALRHKQEFSKGISTATMKMPHRSIECQLNLYDEETVTVLKDGQVACSFKSPLHYPSIDRILRDGKTVVLTNRFNKYTYFNYETSSVMLENADRISFNASETVCMTQKDNTLVIFDNNEPLKMINIQEATLSPQASLLLVIQKDSSAQLISLENQHAVCCVKNIGFDAVKSAQFSLDDNYMLVEDRYSKPGASILIVYDTQSGKICLKLEDYDSNLEAYFYQNYFVIINNNKKAYLIHTNDLQKITPQQPSLTLYDMTKLAIVKTFNDIAKHNLNHKLNPYWNELDKLQRIHPNGKFIATLDKENRWKLIDIESGKVLISYDDVEKHYFNEPDGDIVRIEFKKSQNLKEPSIFSLREVLAQ